MTARTLAALCIAFGSLHGCDDAQPERVDEEVAAAVDQRPPPEKDPRIDYLLVPGARTEHYDVDTSDPVPILLEMLLHGHRDPLRRAREELGSMGDEGLRVVQRVVDTYLDDPQGGAPLRNAIDILQRSPRHLVARENLLRLLRHRDIGVVALASTALEKHGHPEDYDAVRRWFDVIDPEFRTRILQSFWALDEKRASLEFIEWMQNDLHGGFWDDCAARLSEAEDPEVIGRLSTMWRESAPRFKALLAGPCARAGDVEALEFLRAETAAQEPWRQEAAVVAFQKAGLENELANVANASPSTTVRLRAINALATPEAAGRNLDVLRKNLSSPDARVSSACLNVLGRIGDPSAVDRALAMLESNDTEAFQTAMESLRQRMRSDADLARRVLAVLSRRREPEAHLPLADQVRTLQAVGQVPLEESARLLLELSRTARGHIGSMPAERWLIQQVGNVGVPGQRLLYEELARETNPQRRIDLIEGLSVQGGPLATTYLTTFIESDSAQPYEILYTADRLVRSGTVAEIAPLLKRLVLRVEHPDVRIALQSLLWFNYPGPR